MNLKSALATVYSLAFGKINLLLLITNRCNSKCTICNLWKQGQVDLPVKIFAELLESKIVNKNGILLEGGEAILHPNINSYLSMLRPYNYTLLTNGLLPIRLASLVSEYKIPNISVSLDGTPETYYKIRGVDGYHRALKTIRWLKNKTNLSVCFTISPGNDFSDYVHVEGTCKELGVPLLLNIYCEAECSGRSLNKPIDSRYDRIPNSYVNKYNKWVRGEIKSNCFGVRYNCNVYPNGNVVLCQADPLTIFGNLHKKPIDEIWKNRERDYCNFCWLSCNRYLEAKWV